MIKNSQVIHIIREIEPYRLISKRVTFTSYLDYEIKLNIRQVRDIRINQL